MTLRHRSPRLAVAAAVLVLVAFATGVATAGGPFTDVGNTHPFKDEITEFAQVGITAGYPDGSYRGGSPVTRQAMAAFMVRGLPRLAYATSSQLFTVGVSQITLLTVTYDVPGAPGANQRLVIHGTTSWRANATSKANACDNAASQACEFTVGIYDGGNLLTQTVGRVTTGFDGGTMTVHAVVPNAPTGSTRTLTLRATPGQNLQSASLQLTDRQLIVSNVPFFG